MKTQVRWIILILLFCTSCQLGKIPCPKVKEARLRTHYRSPSFFARANQDENNAAQNIHYRDVRVSNTRYVQNVSAAEWDCPRSGRKHYRPKAVKENIRKNMDKIKTDLKKDELK